MATGDFNHDGKLDLAVADDGSGANPALPNSVTILVGRGDGTFQLAPGGRIMFGSNDGPAYLALGDYNLDGNPDIAVSNAHSNSVSVLLGKGDGTFTFSASGPVPVGSYPNGIQTTDFNGDGKPDLAVACGYSSASYVLTGDGKGGFSVTSILSTGALGYDLSVGASTTMDGLTLPPPTSLTRA